VTPLIFQTWSSIVSLEAPLRPLCLGVAHDFGWWTVYRWSTFFFFVSFFPISPNVTTHLSCVLLFFFFNFSANVFYGLFLSLTLLQKFCMFSIQSFNYNLSYIIFLIWSLFFWFLILTLGSFVKVLIVFYFVIQSKFMLSFFNLALILLIFFFEVFSFFFFNLTVQLILFFCKKCF
jgi:hypothetical protein